MFCLSRFDLYFGNVLSVDCFTEKIHSSKQKPDKTAVTWSCRLQWMLNLINGKDPMTRITQTDFIDQSSGMV